MLAASPASSPTRSAGSNSSGHGQRLWQRPQARFARVRSSTSCWSASNGNTVTVTPDGRDGTNTSIRRPTRSAADGRRPGQPGLAPVTMRSGGASFKEAAAAAAARAGCRQLGDGLAWWAVTRPTVGQPAFRQAAAPCSPTSRQTAIPAGRRRLGLHRAAGPEPRQRDGCCALPRDRKPAATSRFSVAGVPGPITRAILAPVVGPGRHARRRGARRPGFVG